jgi:outer membrane protein
MRSARLSVWLSTWLFACVLLPASPAMAASNLWTLYQEMQKNDPAILQLHALNTAADAREDEAKGRLLPQIGLSHSLSRTQRDANLSQDTYDGQSHAITLRQPLYDPVAWQSYKRYQEMAQEQHWSSQEKSTQNALQFVELYFAALAADDERALTQAELNATQRNQSRLQALYQRQLATLPDMLEVEARVTTLEASLLEADNTIHDSRERLAERVGRPIEESLWPLNDATELDSLLRTATDWELLALQQNPALKSHTHHIEAATHAWREARASHLPQVNLNLSAQRSDIGYEGSLSPQSTTLMALVGIQIPLFSGGATHARSTARYAEKMAAEQDYERQKREVIRQVRAMRHKVDAGNSRIQASLKAKHAAEKSRQAAERAFELGVFTAVQVLERIQDEYRAHRNLLQAKYSHINNILMLYRWSGALTSDDIQRGNDLLLAPTPQ